MLVIDSARKRSRGLRRAILERTPFSCLVRYKSIRNERVFVRTLTRYPYAVITKGGSFFASLPCRRRIALRKRGVLIARKRRCFISQSCSGLIRGTRTGKYGVTVCNRARVPIVRGRSKVLVVGPNDLACPHRENHEPDCTIVRVRRKGSPRIRVECL